MAIFRFRQRYEQSTGAIGEICVRLGLTADILTLAGGLFSIFAAYFLATGKSLWGVAMCGLVGIADVLDGATARARGTCTRFGAMLDRIVDRYTEFIILTGILLGEQASPVWVMFAVSGMIMASYVRSTAESVGGLKTCTVGWVGRLEKLVLIVAGVVLQLFVPHISFVKYALIIVGGLSHATAVQRVLYARRIILSSTNGGEETNG